MPSNLTSIDTAGFLGMLNMTEVELPANLEEIRLRAFGDWSNLRTITIKNTTKVISIDSLAFPNIGQNATPTYYTINHPTAVNYSEVDTPKWYNLAFYDNRGVIENRVTFVPY